MDNLFCPDCDSDLIEIIEWPLVKCQNCSLYFDLDDQQEKVVKIPRRRKFDDEF